MDRIHHAIGLDLADVGLGVPEREMRVCELPDLGRWIHNERILPLGIADAGVVRASVQERNDPFRGLQHHLDDQPVEARSRITSLGPHVGVAVKVAAHRETADDDLESQHLASVHEKLVVARLANEGIGDSGRGEQLENPRGECRGTAALRLELLGLGGVVVLGDRVLLLYDHHLPKSSADCMVQPLGLSLSFQLASPRITVSRYLFQSYPPVLPLG